MAKRNTNCLAGMKCPACANLGPLRIVVHCWSMVYDEGTDEYGSIEWDEKDACTCPECGYVGKVGDFTIGSAAYRCVRRRVKAGPDKRYICAACATKRKARWPKGHCATQHSWFCAHCGKFVSLCAIDDWDWPKRSRRPKGPGGGRD